MVGSEPVMRDTPHHIGNRSFVNGKSNVFLLIESIKTFYRSEREPTADGLARTIIRCRSVTCGNRFSLVETTFRRLSRLFHSRSPIHFSSCRIFFGPRRDFWFTESHGTM
jgi:hypothetical protein